MRKNVQDTVCECGFGDGDEECTTDGLEEQHHGCRGREIGLGHGGLGRDDGDLENESGGETRESLVAYPLCGAGIDAECVEEPATYCCAGCADNHEWNAGRVC